MQEEDILDDPLPVPNRAAGFQNTIDDYTGVRDNWTDLKVTQGLIQWFQLNALLSPVTRVNNTYTTAGTHGYNHKFYELLVIVCQSVATGEVLE